MVDYLMSGYAFNEVAALRKLMVVLGSLPEEWIGLLGV